MSVSVFEFSDYKVFVNALIASKPKGGRGLFRRLSQHLNCTSVLVSQIFKGPRDLNLEQALHCSDFLGLGPTEREFFMLLVQRSRAGTQDLKEYFQRKLDTLFQEHNQASRRVVEHRELTQVGKTVFYSNWYYSAVRILSSIDGYQEVEKIAERLSLDPQLVAKVVEFLVKENLCVRESGGIRMGPASTHLDARSQMINLHRKNWRIKSLEKLGLEKKEDLFFSSLVSLSEQDFEALRKHLLAEIANFSKRVEKSPSEKLACLNLDWFEI
jgi:uncharacterized protein (TIGR02147 family)